MLVYLTTLNLARFLQEDAPDLGENPDRQTVAAVDAWKHSDFLCKNYILNGLDNALYNVYSPMVNAKALWESLERKYKTEDAGSKKFVVGKFLDFKMVDSKTVISQVQEFQLILHDIHVEGMEMKLEDLIVRLRIEEDNRQSEKNAGNYHQEAKANVVEQVMGVVVLKRNGGGHKAWICQGEERPIREARLARRAGKGSQKTQPDLSIYFPEVQSPNSASPAAMRRPNLSFTQPQQSLSLTLSSGDAARLLQILPITQEMIARTVSTDMTAKNGPIDPDECHAALDTPPGLDTG
ncbi:hypothetical protein RJ639_027884 [Escallonia herrerae]|uniref:Gag protein n=1 Tax=Escallonia herrerae TaxID=1293975 RepID=A0AA89BEP0_9ASTE|nr:hypothetical protein RJ639_027884 [Escallonia herrerae]